MKDKKATKKGIQSSTESAAIEGLPAQDVKADASISGSAPTLVDASYQATKKTKQKKEATKSIKPAKEPKASKAATEEKKPLNFKVSSDFRREFKTFASAHDLKLSKLLELAFESYRKQRGD